MAEWKRVEILENTQRGREVEKALKSYLIEIEFQERLASSESQCKSTQIEVD